MIKSRFKVRVVFLSACVILATLALPAFASEYTSGVTRGQFVKYGNFVGIGPGVESFNDYDWLKLEIVNISGNDVTLLSTGQFKNGTAIPGNDTTIVWNLEAGTENGVPSTQGPIIAANLTPGDAIPPPNTYTVNKTENQLFLGVSRSVNILNAALSTPDYNTTLTYVYDRLSGMLLESASETTTQAQPEPITSEYSYSIIETNVFGSTSITPAPLKSATPSATTQTTALPTQTSSLSPQPTLGIIPLQYVIVVAIVLIVVIAVALGLRKRTK